MYETLYKRAQSEPLNETEIPAGYEVCLLLHLFVRSLRRDTAPHQADAQARTTSCRGKIVGYMRRGPRILGYPCNIQCTTHTYHVRDKPDMQHARGRHTYHSASRAKTTDILFSVCSATLSRLHFSPHLLPLLLPRHSCRSPRPLPPRRSPPLSLPSSRAWLGPEAPFWNSNSASPCWRRKAWKERPSSLTSSLAPHPHRRHRRRHPHSVGRPWCSRCGCRAYAGQSR